MLKKVSGYVRVKLVSLTSSHLRIYENGSSGSKNSASYDKINPTTRVLLKIPIIFANVDNVRRGSANQVISIDSPTCKLMVDLIFDGGQEGRSHYIMWSAYLAEAKQKCLRKTNRLNESLSDLSLLKETNSSLFIEKNRKLSRLYSSNEVIPNETGEN